MENPENHRINLLTSSDFVHIMDRVRLGITDVIYAAIPAKEQRTAVLNLIELQVFAHATSGMVDAQFEVQPLLTEPGLLRRETDDKVGAAAGLYVVNGHHSERLYSLFFNAKFGSGVPPTLASQLRQ